MRLPRPLAVSLFLATAVVGSLLLIYGLFGATICLDPGGCRPDPIWFTVLPGVGLLIVSLIIFRTAIVRRSKLG